MLAARRILDTIDYGLPTDPSHLILGPFMGARIQLARRACPYLEPLLRRRVSAHSNYL